MTKKLRNQNILVAGGAGYIGSRLVPRLIKEGNKVTVLDLFWFGNNLPPNVPIIHMDVFDVTEDSLRGYDQVIFLAGLSNDPMAEYSPAHNYIYNSAAPAFLAYTAKKAGVKRFIFSGTGSVYGATENRVLNENDESNSLYPYGISKIIGESAVLLLQDRSFSVISMRKGTVSGWSPRMRFDLIVNTMYMKASTTGKITINNPAIWRPILSISDAVRAYCLAVSSPIKVNGIFNVSSGNFTVGEIGKKVVEYFKNKYGKVIEVETKNIADKRDYKISTKKARRVLGFKAADSIDTILKELNKHADLDFDFTNENYYNIIIFKKILNDKKTLLGRKPE